MHSLQLYGHPLIVDLAFLQELKSAWSQEATILLLSSVLKTCKWFLLYQT